jgi:hypothetical protein
VAGATLGAGLGGALGGGDEKSSSGLIQQGLEALPKKARGAEVPGKVKYQGDTRSNDTVPALLSPGEIVLPRSVAQSEEAPEKAKKFVEAIKKQKRPSGRNLAQALSRIAELEARLDAMEALKDLEQEEEENG